MQGTKQVWKEGLLATLAGLLFVDLFLTWHRTSVSVGGAISVDAESSAWAGWGAVAGVLVAMLLVWEGLRFFGGAAVRRGGAWLAFGAAAFTTIEFFAGTVTSVVGPGVLVDVHGRQWPAYVGLVLAGLLVAAAVLVLERPEERQVGRLGLGVK
jgi:hypothetical protein